MIITIEQAIEYLEQNRNNADAMIELCSGSPPDEFDTHLRDEKEVAEIAIEALREKADREYPKLLTIEELKQMNGEPVWVEELSKLIDHTGWALVDVADRGTYKGVPFVKCHICTWDVSYRGLHCYRHKPKEDHHD